MTPNEAFEMWFENCGVGWADCFDRADVRDAFFAGYAAGRELAQREAQEQRDRDYAERDALAGIP